MLSQEEIDYLETSPLTSDIGESPREILVARLERTRELPRNIQNIAESIEVATTIRQLCEEKLHLNRVQTRSVASLLREVLLGERSASSFAPDVERRTGLPPDRSRELVQPLVERFITPNYFQIAQVYEKKHGKGTPLRPQGFPLRPLGFAGQVAGQVGQQATGSAPPPAVPPRVVDLRNGPIPSRLPPPAAPLTPPPPPRQPPTKPELPSPPRTGPSADDLLDNLGKRPAPPPAPRSPEGGVGFARPPGGGTHGPLPQSPAKT